MGSSTIASATTTTAPAPIENAEQYCFPSGSNGLATDVPCYSMEVLNDACFYGPSVFETATATPSASASPAEQQLCYCNPNNAGYMYFEFMQGCGSCYRGHGSAGGYGAYSPDFISSLSLSYCSLQSPTMNFGQFLTSFGGSSVVFTQEASTSDTLGTKTAVSYYFTTTPLDEAVTITQTKIFSDLAGPTTTATASIVTSTSNPTSNSAAQPSDPSSNGGLSQGAKIGLGVGLGLGGALLIALIAGFLLYRRRRSRPAVLPIDMGSSKKPSPYSIQENFPPDKAIRAVDENLHPQELPATQVRTELP